MDRHPPCVVAELVFPLRAVALAASKAPAGGGRETLMAMLVAARLAWATQGPAELPAHQRATRAAAARQWMGALTLPSAVRNALHHLLDATARDDRGAIASAMAKVTDVAGAQLDRKARAELDRVARAVGPQHVRA